MAPRAPGGVMRWLWVAAAVVLAVAGAVLGLAWVTAPGGAGGLTVVEVRGQVEVRGGGGGTGRPATTGMVVGAEEAVRTGADATAVLAAGPDTEIQVEPGSSMVVRRVDAQVVSVELEGGRVRADVRGARRPVRVASEGRAVRTQDGTVAVAVEDGVFAVEVARGSATAEGLPGVDRIEVGSSVVGLPSGEAALGDIPDEVVLDVAWPEARRTREARVPVRGRTAPGARVVVTGGADPVTVRAGADGRFEAMVRLREGAHPVVLEATDPFGRAITDEAELERDTTPPVLRGGAPEGP